MKKNYINQETELKIDKLIATMNLEEKIGQMTQSGISIVGTFGVSFEELLNMMFDGKISHEEFEKQMAGCEQDYHEEEIRAGRLGSMNGVCGAETVTRLQKIAVEESRLGIPLIFGSDIIHGYRTVFPTPLAQSCSWNPEVIREGARVAAQEGVAAGINWTFAPMLDISRDARWGRVTEGLGEDPMLAAEFAKAMVEGFQGENIGGADSLVACAKHFVGYGGAEAGRDYNTVDMSEDKLREFYLPPFKAAVDAGCATLMPSFNDLSGTPNSANKWLLEDVLRKEMGFEGFLVSDANAINECVAHGTAADDAEAAKKAIEAGMDMEMNGPCYAHIPELIASGTLDIPRVDECVRRILRIKFAKGLFEHPYVTDGIKEEETLLKSEFRQKAREAAQKSIVLLKNNNETLPLKKGSKIAVVGKLAEEKGQMMGAWAINAKDEDAVSILSGIQSVQSVSYTAGADYAGYYNSEEVAETVKDADIVIAIVGESKEMSGEAASRAHLNLPGKQEKMIAQLKSLGKIVICVLVNGRPLALEKVEPNCDAILETWQLGVEAGNAIADILFGEVDPSGHLTMSFPYCVGQCPIYYNHFSTGRPEGKSKFTSKYLDTPVQPMYPFGYGLTYTSYEATDLKTEVKEGKLCVGWQVINTGKRTGVYTAQLYVQDLVAQRVRPVKELKAFGQVELAAGESKRIELEVPVAQLGYYYHGTYVVEPGDFRVYAGDSSVNCLEAIIQVTENLVIE